MKYKTQLKLCKTAYPSLFPDEFTVLEQLFFVLGNGYWWYKGQLTSGQTIKETLAEAKACNDRCDEYDRETVKMLAELDAKMIAQFPGWVPVKEKVEKRLKKLTNKKPKNLYPQCEMCKISEIPDDIQNDWLLAAEKALDMVKAGVYVASDNDKKYLSAARRRVNKLKKIKGLA